MITYDEMPDDNAELAKIEIDFPYLKNNTAVSCPSLMTEILEYLSMECPNGDNIKEEDLIFLRTAKLKKTKYWIWKFFDQDGAECYVTVSSWKRILLLKTICIGYDENYYGLTPEQYILGEFYEVF
ncbi:MAG: hypothetical protein GY845_01405 [Planctomycetes bacterium]|nr:hypothetical protein [Planctomycetota bacterium]